MAKTHPPYPPEFRRQMVELVRAGRNPEELAREFEPSAQAIRNWVDQTDLATSPSSSATSRRSSSGEAAATSRSSGSNMHHLNRDQNGMGSPRVQSSRPEFCPAYVNPL